MLRGSLDGVARDRVFGWVQDTAAPGAALCLIVTVDGRFAARLVADRPRADLDAAGFGRHAFELAFAAPLPADAPHMVAVTVEATGEACPGSPRMVPAALRFDPAVQAWLAALLREDEGAEETARRLAFLQSEAAALKIRQRERQALADGRHDVLRLRPGWTAVAEQHADAAQPRRRRALILDETMPVLGHDAGSNAVLSHARALLRLGYAVVLAPADMRAGRSAAAIRAMGIGLAHAPGCGTIEELLWQDEGQYDLVYLHRGGVAHRYLPLVRHTMRRARVVYAVADLAHVRLARQAAAEARPRLAGLIAQTRQQELAAAAAADAVITHSGVEARLLRRAVPGVRVHVVPWAVAPAPGGPGFAARHGVAFIGHYAHAPNRDAAQWLVDGIMPAVRASAPWIGCLLAGSALPDALRAPQEGITPVGEVADLAALLARVRLTVAPLAFGAGVKGKVLDSLAHGVPCVCTPVAAEGIGLGPALRALVAKDSAGLAASIRLLHRDAGLHAACVADGLALIARDYGEARVDGLLRDAVAAPGGA